MPAIFDGHNDSLSRVFPQGSGACPEKFLEFSSEGHLDLPRLIEGGLSGGIFAIFADGPEASPEEGQFFGHNRHQDPPPIDPPLEREAAWEASCHMLANVFRAERLAQGQFKIVSDSQTLLNCFTKKIPAVVLHFEGCEAIDGDLERLEVLVRAGVRSFGVVWSRPNLFGCGVPFAHNRRGNIGPGLTPWGKNLVKRCQELHCLVDMAHLNERGFYDIANMSQAPLVVSHTAAFDLCPSSRNLTNDQLHTIAASRGIAGITFHVPDLRDDGEYNEATPIDLICRHILYIADKIGIDYVGLGSDFDGAMVSSELKDVRGLPKLVKALQSFGLTGADLDKVLYKNWLRVITETWGKV